jgi:phosphoacetylglucosamine mutase
MINMEAETLQKLVSEDQKLFGPPKKKFSYGTAGFRDKGDQLGQVVFRMGILAHLRSLATKGRL